jgi:hypothetical protein
MVLLNLKDKFPENIIISTTKLNSLIIDYHLKGAYNPNEPLLVMNS